MFYNFLLRYSRETLFNNIDNDSFQFKVFVTLQIATVSMIVRIDKVKCIIMFLK